MSRNMLLASFSFVFLLSLSMFLRKEQAVPQNTQEIENEPYLNVHNFEYRKYANNKVVKYLEGDKASLVSIERVELSGKTSGWRYSTGASPKKEKIEANYVQANLSSKHLSDLDGVVNVTDVILGNGVTIRREDLVISTQKAHYLGTESNQIIGDKPVHATLRSQFIDADKGFKLDLSKETIDLFGPIKGVINPDEKKK